MSEFELGGLLSMDAGEITTEELLDRVAGTVQLVEGANEAAEAHATAVDAYL